MGKIQLGDVVKFAPRVQQMYPQCKGLWRAVWNEGRLVLDTGGLILNRLVPHISWERYYFYRNPEANMWEAHTVLATPTDGAWRYLERKQLAWATRGLKRE